MATQSPAAYRASPPSVERFNRLQKVVQDIGGAHHDMEYVSRQRKDSMEMRFNALEAALRKMEARMEDESQERILAEKRLRQDVEERISGVESRLEAELVQQRSETSQGMDTIKMQVDRIEAGTGGDKDEVQAALQKVRRDIEVTCETLLEEQMKLRGKVNEEFQAVHERLVEESQLREASEERIVESLEGVGQYFSRGVDLIR